MSRQANPKLIGLFVLGAVALLVAAVIVIAGGRLFAQTRTYVLVFEDEMRGLRVGAPVTFRGVRIGSVTDIAIRYDEDRNAVAIPVYIEIEAERAEVGQTRNAWNEIDDLIGRGLRAQLFFQSFVTQLLAVELDFSPNTPVRLSNIDPRYPEIPTIRSDISRIRANVTDLMSDIRDLPLAEMVEQLRATLLGLDRLVADLTKLTGTVDSSLANVGGEVSRALQPVPQMLQSLERAARDMSALARSADAQVPELGGRAQAALDRLNATLRRAESGLASIEGTFGEASPIQYQALRTLEEINAAAAAVRSLTEYLQQNPSALLRGKPD